MERIRMGVIGCGVLGSRHAEIYSKIPGIELSGVYDIHPDRATRVAQGCGTKAFSSLEALRGKVDAASVCTPAHTHFEVAKPLLTAGIHLMIEKPLTTVLADADELLRIARDKKVTLQTGHVERYNAGVQTVKDLVRNPRFIECDRIGPYDPRITDVGVILDLMIHDIDIVLYLVGSAVTSVETIAVNAFSPTEDFANCRIVFESGTVCNLTASRMARDRLRKIRVFQENAYISLDYFRQEGVILTKENGTTAYRALEIAKSEPLRAELEDFVSCVRTREQPLVSGEEGRAALAIALRAIEQVSKAQPARR